MPDLPLPVTFRQEIIEKLLTLLRQGESCSLVGIGSSGKSNVVRHIDRTDVREYYLEEQARRVLYLHVDCAALTETPYTAHGLYCLILDVMRKAVRDTEPEVVAQHAELTALWKQALESKSDGLARSNLEDALHIVFLTGIEQVFISLDNFDSFYAEAPARTVNSLRALRDNQKSKVMYVTVTRRELGFLRDPTEVEEFLELVVPATTFAVGPYSEDDARYMIRRLAARETPPRTFSKIEQGWLMELSGRHAGLIRMIYKVTQDQVPLMSSESVSRLQAHPAIVEECEKIWSSLEESERQDLEAVISEDYPARQGLNILLAKGVIRKSPGGNHVLFSPLFANFVVDYMKQRLPIKLLPRQQVRVEDQVVAGLSDVEYHLLSYLAKRYPKPATWGQLLEEMHLAEAGGPGPQSSGPPGRRLDGYLGEIKRKIELDNQEHLHQFSDGRFVLRWPGGYRPAGAVATSPGFSRNRHAPPRSDGFEPPVIRRLKPKEEASPSLLSRLCLFLVHRGINEPPVQAASARPV